jgi:hypothetical protein
MAEVMRRLEYKGDLHTDLLLIARLRRSNGKPNHIAIDLLRDAIQMYQPGKRGTKKFKEDTLKRSNRYYEERGYSRKQQWEAYKFLQALGLVKVTIRYEGYRAKVRYVEPVPESVYELLKTYFESKALKKRHSSLEGTSSAPRKEQQMLPEGNHRRSLDGTTKGLSGKGVKEKGINTTNASTMLVNNSPLPETQQGEEEIPLAKSDDLTTIPAATDCA